MGGVALPVLGYFNILEETECEDIITAETVAVNDDASTQGDLNVLFVVDCGADDWDAQFTAADTLLSDIAGSDDSVDISFEVFQYCNSAEGYSGEANGSFITYDSSFDAASLGMTQESASGGENYQLLGALEACSDQYDAYEDGDTTPFLCVPFISQQFNDTFDAMGIAAETSFANIYLAFMVDEGDSAFDTSIYAVLGAFATGTECINRLDNENAYDNTWWDAQFNCDSSTAEQSYCQHCINYDNSAQLSCVGEDINTIFAGEGVTETQITGSEEECSHSYEAIMFYCMAGVVPLMLWTCFAFCVICRQSRRNNKMRKDFENGLNNNNRTQPAYV